MTQKYKSVYFKRDTGKKPTRKTITLAFNPDAKNQPFNRWYPFTEGYSPEFIYNLIDQYSPDASGIYDPFAGTGTTVIAAGSRDKKTYYSEINPLMVFLIETKIKIINTKRIARKKIAERIDNISRTILSEVDNHPCDSKLLESYNRLFKNSRYFDQKTFSFFLKLRTYIDDLNLKEELVGDCVSVAALSSLIPVSFLKKSGDVRFMTARELKKGIDKIEIFLPAKLSEIAEDIRNESYSLSILPEIILYNSKKLDSLKNITFEAVITSPPYLNGTNCFRNTKLELWFLRYIQYENDLRLYRNQVLTSGINDVSKKKNHTNNLILTKSNTLNSTFKEISKCAYDIRTPLMIKDYFDEIYKVFFGLRHFLKPGSKALIDIGDSIYSGVHVKTDEILIEILNSLGFNFIHSKLLRKRKSRSKAVLSQKLLVFEWLKTKQKISQSASTSFVWEPKWNKFKSQLPHQEKPYSMRNWGHPNHSICSYQGKLKASIAHHLVQTFTSQQDTILDPFCGVGTIPFEAALNGRKSFGMDISMPAYYISSAKIARCDIKKCNSVVNRLKRYIESNKLKKREIDESRKFGFNNVIEQYYEKKTLKEILLARRFFKNYTPKDANEQLVISCLLHILHGNRPYALSRRSHPIVPYSPQGDFIYKSLINNLKDKIDRCFTLPYPGNFIDGRIFCHDCTIVWPQEINSLDAIITSPPFYDSTRFYLANWIRIWFCGWNKDDFKYRPNSFIDEKQKKGFSYYTQLLIQSRERLKKDGVLVFHLGKSKKCDMALELEKISQRWFNKVDLFDESVAHCESHGIRDKGTVTSHQYLVLS